MQIPPITLIYLLQAQLLLLAVQRVGHLLPGAVGICPSEPLLHGGLQAEVAEAGPERGCQVSQIKSINQTNVTERQTERQNLPL
jgi:hypothetical protein